MIPFTGPKIKITRAEIDTWLRKRSLKRSKTNITRATNALKAEKQRDSLPKGRDISAVGGDNPRLVVYGTCRIGGTIVFINTTTGEKWLNVVIALAGHEITEIQKLFLDDCLVVFGASPDARWSVRLDKVDGTQIAALNKIFLAYKVGEDSQTVQADLLTNNPSHWASDRVLNGIAYAYVILKWDPAIFGDGVPDFSFQVKGKKVYDPRQDATVFSDNAALVIADYLTNTRYGVGIPWSDIDIDVLSDSATVCDDAIDLAGGGVEARYTINGYFSMEEMHGRILERMAAAMGGHITYNNGKWKIWAAKWRAPSLTLTEDDLRGPLKVQTLVSRDDIFNGVRGVHVSAAQDFVEIDYPPYKNSSYATIDGEEIFENIDLHFSTSAATCQRLAKLEVERIRQGIQVEVLASLKAYQLQPPENVALTFSRYGWSEKPFEVVNADLLLQDSSGSPELLVSLALRETASGVFDWNSGEQTEGDLAPNTDLPSPFDVPVMTGIGLSSGTADLYLRGDGTVAPRIKVYWDDIADSFISSGGKVEIEAKRSASAAWESFVTVPASNDFAYILDVQDGNNYDVRVRPVSTFQIPGAWTTFSNYFVIGKTAPPADVLGFSAAVTEYGISLNWNAVTDLDVREYEIRLGGASWSAATLVDQIKGTRFNLPLQAAGTYTFRIKAIDTSENYSTTDATASVTINAPVAPIPGFVLEGGDIVLTWNVPEAQFAISEYEISFGNTYPGTLVNKSKSTTLRFKAEWAGTRRFWVAARDVAGNLGAVNSVDINIVVPGEVATVNVEVIDNNVLFRWTAPASGTLPIDHYKILKGATLGGAELLGQHSGTFAAYFEIIAGNYTYWIVPVDTAGNDGLERSIQTAVDAPRDFVLVTNQVLDPDDADTLTNGVVLNDTHLLICVNATETWQDHFINNSWATPQDQIDAGYPIFIQPAESSAEFEITIDLGAVIDSSVLTSLLATYTDIVAGVTLDPTLSFSPDNATWTDYNDWTAFHSGFQYVKVNITAAGDDHALLLMTEMRLILSIKQNQDGGNGTAESTDTNGTQVLFNRAFIDVASITVTPAHQAGETKGVTAVYRFDDVPYPTEFFVYLYSNNTGARIDGDFSWSARGA